MKPGKYDKKAHLLFTPEELDFLQDNTWQMAESFGLAAARISDPADVGAALRAALASGKPNLIEVAVADGFGG